MRYGELYNILKPSVPCIELGGIICSTGALTGDIWNQFKWDMIYYCTSDFEYQEDTNNGIGKIHVYTTGLYRIDLELVMLADSDWAEAISGIFINDVAVYGAYGDGSSYMLYPGYYGRMPLISSKIVYLKSGDNIDFRIFTESGNVIYVADSIGDFHDANLYYSRARITYIPSGGWNNNAGGNIVNRGVRR